MRKLSNEEVNSISGSGVGPEMFNGIGAALGILLVGGSVVAFVAGALVSYFWTSKKEESHTPIA